MSDFINAQGVLLSIMCFFLPPLPIFILKNYDIFNKEILVSVILTLLGHLPGVIFSFYYIFVLYNEDDRASNDRLNVSGYSRLNNNVDDDNLQATPRHHNDLGISNVIRPDLSEDISDEPPQYEAISGPSNNKNPDQKVFNDNKVQQ